MRAIVPTCEIWSFVALTSLVSVFFVGTGAYRNGYWLFTIGCWIVLDLFWAIAGRHKSPTMISRRNWATFAVTVLIYALYCLPLSSVPLVGQRIVLESTTLQFAGAGMCAVGVGTAIWSRHVLAASWNASTTLGEGQSLVQHGPYAIIRHPIYFGFLVSVLGMMLALGELRAFALFFGVEILLKKMGQEECILRTSFPDKYSGYEQRVKRLLPWIW